MLNYLDHLNRLLKHGQRVENRTGIDTLSIFGHSMRFDLSEGFPLVTTKKVHFHSVVHELLWFLQGGDYGDNWMNTAYLKENGVRIWDEWADANGDLGPIYGAQWRGWQGEHFSVDQIKYAQEMLVTDPLSRRNIVSAWNVADLDDMALQPCHVMFQLKAQRIPVMASNVTDWSPRAPLQPQYRLSLMMYQRSADWFLGVPFNIASYALLLHMFAKTANMVPGDLVMAFGDTHLYVNHIEQAEKQVLRSAKKLPTLQITGEPKDIWDYKPEDIHLSGYEPMGALPGKVAV